MELTVSKDAAQWYIREMDLVAGDSIKFFGKVYGPHGGFSFAIAKQEPTNPFELVTVEGINFYVEQFDEWFFADKDLHITLREDGSEPNYEVIVK
ncbi:Fe-S cluster assembly protein HesB [Erysipelothrix sp. HDW6C]|uniref:HesB/YadR/YfhF family protein n=1 Tax=Erysipelothrix sp. HDW6C TaxID=2714930 RepID=UPI0014078753|nr:Fe-S cluster assembly protein HesB [Erysipelothrix sp. HDW6C]QIK69222.1 Fe-S cluster assembly protein HesB [Erysipelothrix sp. HDW6C]